MAETVQGITVQVRIFGTVTGGDGSKKTVDFNYNKTFAEGTGSSQLGSVWEDEVRTLAATTEDIDVAGGLTDFQGAALALNNIKILALENLDTDTGDTWVIGQGSAAPILTILGGTTPTLTVGPGGFALLVNPIDGYSVTATTADKLALTTPDTSTAHVLIAGDNA